MSQRTTYPKMFETLGGVDCLSTQTLLDNTDEGSIQLNKIEKDIVSAKHDASTSCEKEIQAAHYNFFYNLLKNVEKCPSAKNCKVCMY